MTDWIGMVREVKGLVWALAALLTACGTVIGVDMSDGFADLFAEMIPSQVDVDEAAPDWLNSNRPEDLARQGIPLEETP